MLNETKSEIEYLKKRTELLDGVLMGAINDAIKNQGSLKESIECLRAKVSPVLMEKVPVNSPVDPSMKQEYNNHSKAVRLIGQLQRSITDNRQELLSIIDALEL